MLDKENFKIIKKLEKVCNNGAYKVFDFSELCKMFNVNLDSLNNNLKYLKTNEFIDIKYSDDNEICLCLLPKSRQLEEQQEQKTYSHLNVMKVMLYSGLLSGILAFLGAFVAVLIIKWGVYVIQKRKNFNGIYLWKM